MPTEANNKINAKVDIGNLTFKRHEGGVKKTPRTTDEKPRTVNPRLYNIVYVTCAVRIVRHVMLFSIS